MGCGEAGVVFPSGSLVSESVEQLILVYIFTAVRLSWGFHSLRLLHLTACKLQETHFIVYKTLATWEIYNV